MDVHEVVDGFASVNADIVTQVSPVAVYDVPRGALERVVTLSLAPTMAGVVGSKTP